MGVAVRMRVTAAMITITEQTANALWTIPEVYACVMVPLSEPGDCPEESGPVDPEGAASAHWLRNYKVLVSS